MCHTLGVGAWNIYSGKYRWWIGRKLRKSKHFLVYASAAHVRRVYCVFHNVIRSSYERYRAHYHDFVCKREWNAFWLFIDAIWFLCCHRTARIYIYIYNKELKSACVTVAMHIAIDFICFMLNMLATSYLFIYFVNKNYKYDWHTKGIAHNNK